MLNLFKKLFVLAALVVSFTGCAILHHTQIGEIDNRDSDVLIPFTVMVNETGVSVNEVAGIAKATASRGGDALANIAFIVSLFQMGPRTGNPTYNETYANNVIYQIYEKCPSGKVTGLNSIREMRKYPVISGELVKISGYCRKPRKDVEVSLIPSENFKGDI